MIPATAKAALVALGLSTAFVSHSAAAQSPAKSAEAPVKISKEAFKAISELKTAVDAKDYASVPAKVAAAQAVAKTPDDKLTIAKLQLQAAMAQNNPAATEAAIEAMIASGAVTQPTMISLYTNLAKIQYNSKQFDKAAASFERALAIDPNNGEALSLLAETRFAQGRTSEAVAIIDRVIKTRLAAGQKPEDALYKRAVGIAYKAKLRSALDLSRQWVMAYPTPANWRDAIGTFRNLRRTDEGQLLDVMRFAHAAGALNGNRDYYIYAMTALEASAPAEAEKLIADATAAKQIDPADPMFKEVATEIKAARTGRDLASLNASVKEVDAAPTGRPALRVADGFYGVGDYAKAAELYRLALKKGSVPTSTVNLRLGAALARAGDKAGATAALQAVTGGESELAKYWLTYLAIKG